MTLFPWSDTTRWKQHHFHIISMSGNVVISRWKPHGFHVLPQLQIAISLETTHFVVSLLFPCHFNGFHIDTTWFQMLTPCGFKCGYHVLSMQTPCDVQETTWKPAQKTALHEATNWLPCLILYPSLLRVEILPVLF